MEYKDAAVETHGASRCQGLIADSLVTDTPALLIYFLFSKTMS